MNKISWFHINKTTLQAILGEVQPRGYEVGLRETDMIPIQEWCGQNKCGRRTSFDTFKFRTEKEKVMFLLKWT
jgi:hypothetical protein